MNTIQAILLGVKTRLGVGFGCLVREEQLVQLVILVFMARVLWMRLIIYTIKSGARSEGSTSSMVATSTTRSASAQSENDVIVLDDSDEDAPHPPAKRTNRPAVPRLARAPELKSTR